MTAETISIVKLIAEEGMVLSNGETCGTEIYLGVNDSPYNWHEIPVEQIPTSEEVKEV